MVAKPRLRRPARQGRHSITDRGRILFVYNAAGGLLARCKDYIHKIVSPETYPCNLCQLTYGNLGMKRAWRRFVRDLPYTAVFLHRDELVGPYARLRAFPLAAVFVEEGGRVSLLISAAALDAIPDLAALQETVLTRVRERARQHKRIQARTAPVS